MDPSFFIGRAKNLRYICRNPDCKVFGIVLCAACEQVAHKNTPGHDVTQTSVNVSEPTLGYIHPDPGLSSSHLAN